MRDIHASEEALRSHPLWRYVWRQVPQRRTADPVARRQTGKPARDRASERPRSGGYGARSGGRGRRGRPGPTPGEPTGRPEGPSAWRQHHDRGEPERMLRRERALEIR